MDLRRCTSWPRKEDEFGYIAIAGRLWYEGGLTDLPHGHVCPVGRLLNVAAQLDVELGVDCSLGVVALRGAAIKHARHRGHIVSRTDRLAEINGNGGMSVFLLIRG